MHGSAGIVSVFAARLCTGSRTGSCTGIDTGFWARPLHHDSVPPTFETGCPMPAIIAHRGASLEAPENTIRAFERAIGIGVDRIELDLRRTADGGIVVLPCAQELRATDGTHAPAELTPPKDWRERVAALSIRLEGESAAAIGFDFHSTLDHA